MVGDKAMPGVQFTLWSADIEELQKWVPRVVDRVKRLPGIVDVTDREQGGLQANITIDREAASRFGVRVQDIDNALDNAFRNGRFRRSTVRCNQYRVILEVDAAYQRDPIAVYLRAGERQRAGAFVGSDEI